MKIFGGQHRIVLDYDKLGRVSAALQELNQRIVVTIGSWDMLHIGHVRYLIKAKVLGDILVVGVDSDRAIKQYKGLDRPVIPEAERLEMLSYQAPVDFITLVDDIDDRGQWQYGLIRVLRPDVFVAVEDSYPEQQRQEISRHCRELVVLPRQAETSTSKKIGEVVKTRLTTLKSRFSELIDSLE